MDHVVGPMPSMSILVNTPRSIRRNVMFVALFLVGVVIWWRWITTLLTLAFTNEQYSHVLLVLPVSLLLALLEGRAKNVKPAWSPFPALALVLVALTTVLAVQFTTETPGEPALIIGIVSLVMFWIGLVMLFLGVSTVRQLLFALLFLFLIVPIPQVVVDNCIVALQVASTQATYALFRCSGVPVLKNGFVLTFPTLDIEIAKQCSGIRSSLTLLISGMVLAHLYVRSHLGKILLVLAVVPISIAKNAVRIFALSMLGMKVNPAFLYGGLHRNGGVVFFLLALACLAGVLKAVNKCEEWNARTSLPAPSV
jgi:exosortase